MLGLFGTETRRIAESVHYHLAVRKAVALVLSKLQQVFMALVRTLRGLLRFDQFVHYSHQPMVSRLAASHSIEPDVFTFRLLSYS